MKKFLLVSAVLLSACAFAAEDLNDEEPKVPEKVSVSSEKKASAGESQSSVAVSEYEYKTSGGMYSSETGTFVGQKITDLRRELEGIVSRTSGKDAALDAVRKKIIADAGKYHELVAVINSRLQVGTTPGNPILNDKWHQANLQLEAISGDVASLNELLAELTSDSGMITYVLDSVRAAFNISGAVDEDHSQLKVLENQAVQTSVQIERLFNEINNDVNRQQQFLAVEKKNLNTLAMAIRDGQLYSQDPLEESYGSIATSTVVDRDIVGNLKGKKPLVAIRFDKRKVAYEQTLYKAVKRAVDKKNNVRFDVVGITPLRGTVSGADAKSSADAVARSIINMGVPASRVNVVTATSSNAQNVEVKVFVK